MATITPTMPVNSYTTRWDSPFRVERMTGIEPAFSAWEADVLPLNYIRVAC